MSQIIHVSINPKLISCILSENLKEREYNFSLKLSEKHKEYLSDHSENYKNPLWMHRVDNEAYSYGSIPSINNQNEEDGTNYNNAMEESKKMKRSDTIRGIRMKSNHSKFSSEKNSNFYNEFDNLDSKPLIEEPPTLKSKKSQIMNKLEIIPSNAKVNIDSLQPNSVTISEFKPAESRVEAFSVQSPNKKEVFWKYGGDSYETPPFLEVSEKHEI